MGLGLAVLLAACRLTEPMPHPAVEGTFVRAAGGTLPPPYVLVADTLRLATDGTGVEHVVLLVPRAGRTVADSVSAWRNPLTYVSAPGRLLGTLVCPPNASCVAGPHFSARTAGARLIVEPLGIPGETTRYYARVPQ